MKVKILANALKEVLQRGSLAITVDSMKASPYKGFGRITYEDGRLYVQSEGQSVSSKAFVHTDDLDAENGACVCNLELIMGMIKFMPKDEPLTLEYQAVEGDMGHISVRSTKSSAQFGCAHPDLYMMMKNPPSDFMFSIDAGDFFKSVSRVTFAGDSSDADSKRSNVCVRCDEGTVYVAAARREMLCYSEVGHADFDMDIFLPLDTIRGLSKFFLDGDVKFVDDVGNLYLVQERGWVRVCMQSVPGFPRFTAFAEHKTSGKSRMAVACFANALGACMKANQIEAGAVISDRKITLCAMGTDNGTKYKGSVMCSEDSDVVSDSITFSPFMIMGFFKGMDESTFDMEVSERGESPVVYMKFSDGTTHLFVKERKTMTTDPVTEINNV